MLFNLYSVELFRDTLTDVDEKLTINVIVINNFRYADDTVLMGSSENYSKQ